MKLEVGMYVRTKDGLISKIQGINEYSIALKNTCCERQRDKYFTFPNEEKIYEISKSSFNIIDLIEVGDYVNGYCVDSVHNNEIITTQLIDTSWSDEDCNGEMVYYDETELVRIEPYEIHTILTHEQYEANCYKVGE